MKHARWATLACVALAGLLSTASSPTGPACGPSFNVGFRIVRAGGTDVAVWYPSSGREAPHTYAKNLRGSAALDSPVEGCARFPLVVFSHGFGGCGIQTVFFTEELARRGYVVAAPDHSDAVVCSVTGKGSFRPVQTDESFLEPKKWTERTHTDRRDDLKRVITWFRESSDLRGAIDGGQIGAVGHSLGGYAVLGIAGGWESWTDDRLRAAVLFSPYAAPFLEEQRLRSLRVPVMYQGAQGDWGITPSLRGRNGAYGRSAAPKYYVELKAGNHFIWTNLECGSRSVAQCLKADKTARLINEYAIAFLDRYVKGVGDSLARLKGRDVARFDRTER